MTTTVGSVEAGVVYALSRRGRLYTQPFSRKMVNKCKFELHLHNEHPWTFSKNNKSLFLSHPEIASPFRASTSNFSMAWILESSYVNRAQFALKRKVMGQMASYLAGTLKNSCSLYLCWQIKFTDSYRTFIIIFVTASWHSIQKRAIKCIYASFSGANIHIIETFKSKYN